MKITIGTQDGETFQTQIEDSAQLTGKKIGEEFDGGIIGLSGYTLKITGGSDRDGFPMKESIEGTGRKKVLLKEGVGLNIERDGERQRKSVRGDTVSNQIEQLNTKVVESGSKTVEELLGEE
ncbi:MAG: 30S ribosomal protein S6e [Candidatus Nanosalina sp.]